MSNKKTFVIIDGNAIIHRAYHALPPMSASDGTSVNAVYGFASMLLKIINDIKPDYLTVSFDIAGGSFRDQIYEEYKATRVKADDDLYAQIPIIHELAEAFGIPVYEKEGFEADDVIGTIAELNKTKKHDVTTIIVTGDKDMLQLVDDDITEVYLLKKGMSDFELYDEAKVVEKFGFGPNRIVDFKAFKGDMSDNIPGIKGIGEKVATSLIRILGGLEDVYEVLHDKKSAINDKFSVSVIKKLLDGEKDARMSRELAMIRRDVTDLDFCLEKSLTNEFDRERVIALFRKLEFFSLIKRIPDLGNQVSKKIERKENKKIIRKILIIEDKDIKKLVSTLKKEKKFACKAILSSNDVLTSDLLGFVFVSDRVNAFVDTKKIDKEQLEFFFELFQYEKITIVGHDIKQLVKVLITKLPSCRIPYLFDIMIASYILNSNTRAHGLQQIIFRELGEEVVICGTQASLFGVDPQVVADELRAVWDVAKIYEDKFGMEEKNVFETIEMPLISVLADMELNGIAIDIKMLEDLSKKVHHTIALLERKIWKEAGTEFNVSSSSQLRDILFDTLELPTEYIKKVKTGYSTSASELEKLREHHDIIPLIEEYREMEKLRNTYIDVLPKLINKKTGRIHTNFNQAVASTGRLSSSDPNLQNIPIRTDIGKEVRNAFIAEDGYFLISADYSQIELRIAAHLAGDKKMIEIFESGQDIHSATAATINGVSLQDVTPKQRSAAKAINFGILYGMGAFGMSTRTGISPAESRIFIDKYFHEFKDLKKYMFNIIEQAKKDGYVETLFGRKRHIPELESQNFKIRASGERMAINMSVQGTAADMMKLAMIRTRNEMNLRGVDLVERRIDKKDLARILLQVHDELLLEVKEGMEKEVAKLVEKEMRDVLILNVPVVVDVRVGKRWGELKSI